MARPRKQIDQIKVRKSSKTTQDTKTKQRTRGATSYEAGRAYDNNQREEDDDQDQEDEDDENDDNEEEEENNDESYYYEQSEAGNQVESASSRTSHHGKRKRTQKIIPLTAQEQLDCDTVAECIKRLGNVDLCNRPQNNLQSDSMDKYLKRYNNYITLPKDAKVLAVVIEVNSRLLCQQIDKVFSSYENVLVDANNRERGAYISKSHLRLMTVILQHMCKSSDKNESRREQLLQKFKRALNARIGRRKCGNIFYKHTVHRVNSSWPGAPLQVIQDNTQTQSGAPQFDDIVRSLQHYEIPISNFRYEEQEKDWFLVPKISCLVASIKPELGHLF